MAKIPFSKLGVKADNEVSLLSWGEYEIEVKKYLPVSEKTEMVSKVINKSTDDNGYYNPFKVTVYLTLETIYYYTNLTFTDKQRENELKLYDAIISSGLFDQIIALIPAEEWTKLQETTWHTIKNLYEYKNSIMGILETVSADYSNLNLDAMNLSEAMSNKENVTLLRDVLDKLG